MKIPLGSDTGKTAVPKSPGSATPPSSISGSEPPIPAIPLSASELSALGLSNDPILKSPDPLDSLVAEGKISTFGGPSDTGMKPGEGLAMYEPHEIINRPDLFIPRTGVGVSKMLNPDSNYIAMRFPEGWNADPSKRKLLQTTPFEVTNPSTGKVQQAYLVDYGPHPDTGRAIDMSPGLANRLGLKTNDVAKVRPMRHASE